MVRLFRATARKGQWNRALDYSRTVPRPRPLVCCLISICLLACLWLGSRSAILTRRIHADGGPPRQLSAASSSSAISAAESPGRRRLLETSTSNPNATFYNYKCERVNSSTRTAVAWESCDTEKATGNMGGWIVLYIVCTIIIFIAVAIVCDDFFVPSLEIISERLKLSEDVAGATFMAAGSSAPELFSSVAAVAFDSDAGVGTIAGSAVFNLLVIISLTAAFAGKVLHLDWRPLARDSIYYLISIIYFIVMMQDTVVQIWDAVVLLVLYILYIVIMVLNPRLMNRLAELENRCRCQCRVEPTEEEEAAESAADEPAAGPTSRRASVMSTASGHSFEKRQFRHDRRNSVLLNLHSSPSGMRTERRESIVQSTHNLKVEVCIIPEEKKLEEVDLGTHEVTFQFQDFDSSSATLKEEDSVANGSYGGKKKPGSQTGGDGEDAEGEGESEGEGEGEEDDDDDARIQCCSCCSCCPDIRGAPPKKSETMTPAKWTVYVLKWIVFVLAFPFLCLFSWTIPECSKEHLKKYFVASFLLSVLWIAALSFGMVTVVARLGCLLGVDTFVMSLVVLAAGTSVPDLLSSIIVARDGFGDMAVSNAIGSNVFDINMGLGLPFFIRLCINKIVPLDMFSDSERRSYCEGHMKMIPHVKFGIILIILLVIALIVIGVSKFRLGKVIGISFFCLYIAFLVYAFCQEFLCEYDC